MNRSLVGAAVLVLAGIGPAPVWAQGLRGKITTSGLYLDYPVLVRDSIPETEVPGDGTTRRLPDGTIVSCVPGGYCYWYRSGPRESGHVIREDLEVTGWTGWRGVSSRLHVRGRYGSDDFWPGSGKDVTVLNASVDVDRSAWRFRAGRQDRTGGLGFNYFDGVDVLWKSLDELRVEAFVGRSLVLTALESHTGDLVRDSDELFPDRPATLIGFESRVRLGLDFSGSWLYQRELRTDRAGLYSERMALDTRWAPPAGVAEFSADYDVASAAFNDARLRLSRPIRKSLTAAVQARYYRPYFDLWTIWGVFVPVGFTQGGVDVTWAARPHLNLSGTVTYRDYGDTHTGTNLVPVEGDGWLSHVAADWTRGPFGFQVLTGVNKGYGAYRGTIDLSAYRRFGDGEHIGVFGSGTQQFAEFRFGEGATRGAGVEGRLSGGQVSADGRVGVYRHSFDNRPGFDDYTQVRGQVAVTVGFGTEPSYRKPPAPAGDRP